MLALYVLYNVLKPHTTEPFKFGDVFNIKMPVLGENYPKAASITALFFPRGTIIICQLRDSYKKAFNVNIPRQ